MSVLAVCQKTMFGNDIRLCDWRLLTDTKQKIKIMITEKVEIRREDNGVLADVSGSLHIEKLLNEYKKEQMPNADEPFHYEAEIASGFKYFLEWLKRKEQ